MEKLRNVFYKPAEERSWQGRVDGEDPVYHRWHQRISCVDLNAASDLQRSLVILGFCCDEGVRRNEGRIGAKDGPEAIRKVLAGVPVHVADDLRLLDAGDVICMMEDLEAAQAELADRIAQILRAGGFPLLLGGGHEITYGHAQGLKQALGSKIGIINLDAHLDIRELKDGRGTSGTGFFQLAEEAQQAGQDFHYLAIGIQDISNTRALFDYAKAKQVEIIWQEEIQAQELDRIKAQVEAFASKVEHIYLSIDLDVFAAACAPGVSAVAFNGIWPDASFQELYRFLLKLPNLRSMDIAELNPLLDIDNRTAKLAVDLIYKLGRKF